jgi:FkbM family methyltransferase
MWGSMPSRRESTVTLPVRGIGKLHARLGETDLDCIRYVFGVNPFDTAFVPLLDARIQARYEAILAAGGTPVIVDAGANIGATALWYARRYPQAAIVAVEPDAQNVAMIRLNCGDEPRITILDAAIGSTPGHASVSRDESWAIQTERVEHGVRIVTIDDAVAVAGGGELFIVKVNIEGFERDLFAENLDWLTRAHAVLVEPHDYLMPGHFVSGPLQKAMAAHDFELFIRNHFLIYARL